MTPEFSFAFVIQLFLEDGSLVVEQGGIWMMDQDEIRLVHKDRLMTAPRGTVLVMGTHLSH